MRLFPKTAFFFVAFFCIFLDKSHGQAVKLALPDYTVHSPNATDLGRYGEYPVNLSTGVPAIGVSLFNIKSGKLELPIDLSYHASGIRVGQESSFVGLGWVLNAGGVITRTVKDRPDDQSFGFLQNGKALPDYNSIDGRIVVAGQTGNNNDLKNMAVRDGQPDLFEINMPGLSGEFCLDNNGNFVSTSLDSLRYNVVTDKTGKVYRFGKSLSGEEAFETTQSLASSSTDVQPTNFNPTKLVHLPYSSSYYLTEIISADQADTISFKYNRTWYSLGKLSDVTRFVLNAGGPLNPTDETGSNFNGTTLSFLNTTIYNARILDKVIFKNGYVLVNTANDRLDLESTVADVPSKTRITGLTLYNNSNTQLQKIGFDNGNYFQRTGAGGPGYNVSIQDYQTRSLKLNGVQFYGSDNTFIKDFKFEYDTTPLAPLNTTSQDLWGYYNGKNNSSFIPTTFYSNSFTGAPVYIGEDRKADINYMKAAVLNKITFPGGGYTTYEYEPNYYLNNKQLEGKIEATKQIDFYAVNRLSSCSPAFLNGIPANNIMEFDVTEDMKDPAGKLYIMFTDYKDNNNGLPMTFRYTNTSTGETYYYEHGPGERTQSKVYNLNISVRKGNHIKLEANTNGVTGSNASICNSPYIEVGLSYKYWQPTSQDQITTEQAGGLRIKNTTVFDSDSKPVSAKNYEYGDTKYGPNAIGVGTLLTDPSLNFFNFPLLYTQNEHGELKNVLWFSSNSQVELGQNQGAPVFYNKVTEKEVSYTDNNTSNGKTEYYFRAAQSYHEPRSGATFPYVINLYPSWDNSDLTKILQYKMLNNSYVPVRSIEYTYEQATEKRIKTAVVSEFGPPDEHSFPLNGAPVYVENTNRYYYYNFYVPCGKFYKTKETNTEYVNGAAALTSVRSFNYNKYTDLIKESGINSKGQSWENDYKYTSDLNYTNLMNKHMVSLPVQSEQLLNGKVTGGTILNYNDFGSINARYSFKSGILRDPVSYTDVNSIPDYYERRESMTYRPSGKNIQEVKLENSTVSYLWSYNNEHIIAIIKNASYAAVESILSAAAIEAFTKMNPDRTAIENFVAPLKTGLPDAKIETYSYAPLIGLTSQTDEKGKAAYYEYDQLQRLRNVKDQNGNILKNNTYHYKN
jgi:hypothetical protein